MSEFITTAFVQQYKANVQLKLQQMGSKLRDKVMPDTAVGKAAKIMEQIGPVNAKKRTSRHADTPLISTPHDARWCFPSDYEWADLIDDQDKARMLIDPQSPYVKNGANACGRAMDDEIIAAFFATSKVGENGTTDEAWDTDYQIAEGGVGMTVSKLRDAMEILMAAEVDTDNEELYVCMAAKQHNNLLNETQAISLDYTDKPVLVDGKISHFMGFNFVISERLQLVGDDRYCPCWAKSGMGLCIWNDIEAKVSERADKSYATQPYTKVTCGATRMEIGKVVRIICDE